MSSRMLVRRQARNRGALTPSIGKKASPALVTLVKQQVTVTKVQVTYNSTVMLSGIPAYKAGLGGTFAATAAVSISPTVIEVTFAGGTAANPIVIPADDPAVRTPSGGFVPAGSYVITP